MDRLATSNGERESGEKKQWRRLPPRPCRWVPPRGAPTGGSPPASRGLGFSCPSTPAPCGLHRLFLQNDTGEIAWDLSGIASDMHSRRPKDSSWRYTPSLCSSDTRREIRSGVPQEPASESQQLPLLISSTLGGQ